MGRKKKENIDNRHETFLVDEMPNIKTIRYENKYTYIF